MIPASPKHPLRICALVTLLAALAAPGRAGQLETVRSRVLLENPAAWDGRELLFGGEAIGEAMPRPGGAWLHLNDDAYQWRNIEEGEPLGGYNSGLAVWVPEGSLARLRFFGDYRHTGDVALVRGTFHAACREHGGDLDIHATSLEIVREGRAVAHRLNVGRLRIAIGLLAVAGFLFALDRRARRRRI
jgi:hypothetical protein